MSTKPVKTSELDGIALDWAVTLLEAPEALKYGVEDWREQRRSSTHAGEFKFRWHQSWTQAGPIIEREGIGLLSEARDHSVWKAQFNYTKEVLSSTPIALVNTYCLQRGPTPLIAAMRCYVQSKIGDTVAIPEELT